MPFGDLALLVVSTIFLEGESGCGGPTNLSGLSLCDGVACMGP